MEGWNWTTLDGFVDLAELDELLAAATNEVAAPALAFSVHDSDTVYVAGTDPSGLRFRLVINPDAWEDELPPQQLDEAVAWSREHARPDLSKSDLGDVLERDFAFAEEGLDVLFVRMGLVPASLDSHPSGHEPPPVDFWGTFEPIDAPERQILEGGRWHTTFQYADVSASLIAAEEPPSPWVSAYGARRGVPIIHFGKAQTREELWSEATRQGFTLGEWEEIPESVPRDLASTCAWVLRG